MQVGRQANNHTDIEKGLQRERKYLIKTDKTKSLSLFSSSSSSPHLFFKAINSSENISCPLRYTTHGLT